MKELSNKDKELIETELLKEVMLKIEDNIDYQESERMSQLYNREVEVLKDKEVIKSIKEFSERRELDIKLVKDFFKLF